MASPSDAPQTLAGLVGRLAAQLFELSDHPSTTPGDADVGDVDADEAAEAKRRERARRMAQAANQQATLGRKFLAATAVAMAETAAEAFKTDIRHHGRFHNDRPIDLARRARSRRPCNAPRARRTAARRASGLRAGQDPGSSEGDKEPPPAEGAPLAAIIPFPRRRPTSYQYGCISAAARGAEVGE